VIVSIDDGRIMDGSFPKILIQADSLIRIGIRIFHFIPAASQQNRGCQAKK
jgi:hypothetical protein